MSIVVTPTNQFKYLQTRGEYDLTGGGSYKFMLSNAAYQPSLDWPAWAFSNNYTKYDVIVPTVPNGHAYESISGIFGTSAPSEPIFPTDGGTVQDGTVVWRDLGINPPQRDFRDATPDEMIGAVTGATTWAATTAYTVDTSFVVPSVRNGAVFRAIATGTSGGSEPDFAAVAQGDVTPADGTTQWRSMGQNPGGDEIPVAGGYPAGGFTVVDMDALYNINSHRQRVTANNLFESPRTFTARRGTIYQDGSFSESLNPTVAMILLKSDNTDFVQSGGAFEIKWELPGIIDLV